MSDPTNLSIAQRESITDLGFVIVRQAFSKQCMQSLLDAMNRLIDRALAGDIELSWIDRENRLPARTSNLLAPMYFDDAYVQWLERDLISLLEGVVQAPLRHSLFGALAAGGGQPYKQGWHRDLAIPGGDDEQKVLDWFAPKCVQMNAPVQPADRFLQVVPASHRRVSTPQELQVVGEDAQGDMPDMITVHLEPGDIIAYNANLWHRGWNPNGETRWTMHSAFWRADMPVMSHEQGQLESLQTPGHLDRFPPRARELINRYIKACPGEGHDVKSAVDLALAESA